MSFRIVPTSQSSSSPISRKTSFFDAFDIDIPGQNPYNSRGCPDNFFGPDCSIPYILCPDLIWRCLNNSQCKKLESLDPDGSSYDSNRIKYGCDCSFANSVSSYAGYQCEHPATTICAGPSWGDDPNSPKHFCANNGLCGTFIQKGRVKNGGGVRTGCHCSDAYAGAHCQYLKALYGDDAKYIGSSRHRGNADFAEVQIESVGENFYAFERKGDVAPLGPSVSAHMILSVVAIIILFSVGLIAIVIGVRRSMNGKRQQSGRGQVLAQSEDENGLELHEREQNVVLDANGDVGLVTNENPHAEII